MPAPLQALAARRFTLPFASLAAIPPLRLYPGALIARRVGLYRGEQASRALTR